MVVGWARRALPLLVLALLLLFNGVLLTGCDAPLSYATLLTRLGEGRYAEFTVTFYRYSPDAMRGFVAEDNPRQYLYERILDRGPIERLQFTFRPKFNKCELLRTGNDIDQDHRLITKSSNPQRGPLERVIRLLKDDPNAGAALFQRDLYAAEETADPDYFSAFDGALHDRLARQSGVTPTWQFAEFLLQYQLPQPGPPVYTAEAALIPLTPGGAAGTLVGALMGVAEDEFAKLKDPLAGQESVEE
ncbi:MAG: hypothetical protein ABI743_00550 [bacterium]